MTQHSNLLLDVFDLVFGFLKIDDFDGRDLFGAIVDALEHLAEGTLADPLEFGEELLRVCPCVLQMGRRKRVKGKCMKSAILRSCYI